MQMQASCGGDQHGSQVVPVRQDAAHIGLVLGDAPDAGAEAVPEATGRAVGEQIVGRLGRGEPSSGERVLMQQQQQCGHREAGDRGCCCRGSLEERRTRVACDERSQDGGDDEGEREERNGSCCEQHAREQSEACQGSKARSAVEVSGAQGQEQGAGPAQRRQAVGHGVGGVIAEARAARGQDGRDARGLVARRELARQQGGCDDERGRDRRSDGEGSTEGEADRENGGPARGEDDSHRRGVRGGEEESSPERCGWGIDRPGEHPVRHGARFEPVAGSVDDPRPAAQIVGDPQEGQGGGGDGPERDPEAQGDTFGSSGSEERDDAEDRSSGEGDPAGGIDRERVAERRAAVHGRSTSQMWK